MSDIDAAPFPVLELQAVASDGQTVFIRAKTPMSRDQGLDLQERLVMVTKRTGVFVVLLDHSLEVATIDTEVSP